jgi:Ulp1 family protease
VKPLTFMGNYQLNSFTSSAKQQLDHFVPGSKSRFHTIDCGFMNTLYYHTSTTRNVYKYNNIRIWVKNIKLLDYDYVFIPTNNNKLHWVLFIIVPAQRRVEYHDSLHDTNDFHYESLNVIIRFIKDYQLKNKLQVNNWSWSVRIVSAPKQNHLYDCGVFVCMRMYCMLKGWDFNSIPVGMYTSHLILLMVYVMLKWKLHAEDNSFKKIRPHHDNAFILPYNGSTRVLY